MIDRIAVLAIALAAFSSLPAAHAQPAGKMSVIGYLHLAEIATSVAMPAFIRGLRDLGYEEGRNIAILRREALRRHDRLPQLAADLVRRKVDVIVCVGAAAQAAVDATSTTPIVVMVAADYVARGWAKSLRRPGGNVTGLSTQAVGLMDKQLELLKEVAPGLKRAAILAFADNRGHAGQIHRAKEAAELLGLDVVAVSLKGVDDLVAGFRRMKAENVDGFIVLRHGTFVRLRRRIAAFARETGLPSLFGHAHEAKDGGLMAYGADTKSMFYDAASYVDKILRGADPAELPISQARKFNLTVNLKTAKALGITIPPSILLRADEVIE